MELTSRRKTACFKNRGNTLRAVLCLVIFIFLLQYAGLYLNFRMHKSVSDKLTKLQSSLGFEEKLPDEGEAHTARQMDSKSRTQAILYSYAGVDTLPSSDILTDVLSKHPDVFFIDQPLREMNDGAYDTFPRFYRSTAAENLIKLGQCDAQSLTRLHASVLQSSSPTKNTKQTKLLNAQANARRLASLSAKQDASTSTVERCQHSAATVASVLAQSELEIEHLLLPNNSIKIVHLVADPRLVTLNLWRQRTMQDQTEQISINQDIPIIRAIAADYCERLLRDVKHARKHRRDGERKRKGSSTEERYKLLRYEDLITKPASTSTDILHYFLHVSLSKEFDIQLQQISPVNTQDLYDDVHLNVIEIAEGECKRSMELLGYGLMATERGGQTNDKRRHHDTVIADYTPTWA